MIYNNKYKQKLSHWQNRGTKIVWQMTQGTDTIVTMSGSVAGTENDKPVAQKYQIPLFSIFLLGNV